MKLMRITVVMAFHDDEIGQADVDNVANDLVNDLIDAHQAEVAFTTERQEHAVPIPDPDPDNLTPDGQEPFEAWQDHARDEISKLGWLGQPVEGQ